MVKFWKICHRYQRFSDACSSCCCRVTHGSFTTSWQLWGRCIKWWLDMVDLKQFLLWSYLEVWWVWRVRMLGVEVMNLQMTKAHWCLQMTATHRVQRAMKSWERKFWLTAIVMVQWKTLLLLKMKSPHLLNDYTILGIVISCWGSLRWLESSLQSCLREMSFLDGLDKVFQNDALPVSLFQLERCTMRVIMLWNWSQVMSFLWRGVSQQWIDWRPCFQDIPNEMFKLMEGFLRRPWWLHSRTWLWHGCNPSALELPAEDPDAEDDIPVGSPIADNKKEEEEEDDDDDDHDEADDDRFTAELPEDRCIRYMYSDIGELGSPEHWMRVNHFVDSCSWRWWSGSGLIRSYRVARWLQLHWRLCSLQFASADRFVGGCQYIAIYNQFNVVIESLQCWERWDGRHQMYYIFGVTFLAWLG